MLYIQEVAELELKPQNMILTTFPQDFPFPLLPSASKAIKAPHTTMGTLFFSQGSDVGASPWQLLHDTVLVISTYRVLANWERVSGLQMFAFRLVKALGTC